MIINIMKQKGLFITFEGPDGSGKSTNSLLFCDYLRKKGYKVVHTREPGGTKLSEFIRDLLLKPGERISPVTELLLYAASRAQHVKDVILPAIEAGKVVVCDRFSDATIAYQGFGRKLDLGMIQELNRIATEGLKPDLTILLDVNTKEGLKRARRIKGKKDRIEQEKVTETSHPCSLCLQHLEESLETGTLVGWQRRSRLEDQGPFSGFGSRRS